MNVTKQGEAVKVAYSSSSTSIGAVTSVGTTNPTVVGIFDSDNNTRVLQPWERLILDAISGSATGGQAYLIAGSTYAQSTLLCLLNTTSDEILAGVGEGMSLPTGQYPYIFAQTSTVAVVLTGSARIINGKTQGVRPNWRESLVSQGNL